MTVCPSCHGDGTVTVESEITPGWVLTPHALCTRCDGTGHLEPAGESVAARAARERVLQGEPWPGGDEAGA